VAESQEPIESLVKKEAEPQRDPIVSRSTSAIIFVCVLLLMLSTGLALYDEGFAMRPWRPMQQEFVKRYTRYLKSIRGKTRENENEVKQTPEYQQLHDEATASRVCRPARHSEKADGSIGEWGPEGNAYKVRLLRMEGLHL
jgi:hypothetical protein